MCNRFHNRVRFYDLCVLLVLGLANSRIDAIAPVLIACLLNTIVVFFKLTPTCSTPAGYKCFIN
jgi:hypothetical protein